MTPEDLKAGKMDVAIVGLPKDANAMAGASFAASQRRIRYDCGTGNKGHDPYLINSQALTINAGHQKAFKPLRRDYMMKYLTLCLFLALPIFTASSQPAFAEPQVAVLSELQQRPGNPAIGVDGTVYFTMHPFDNPEFKVMRLENGKAVPYPNEEISKSLAAVIGIQATKDGTLWWLDMGNETISPKLVGWDTKANRLKAVHVIPREASVANSFHQDFAIDERRNKAFIADMSRGGMIDESEPAIVVMDLNTGQVRRVLQGHKVFQPGDTPIIAEGKAMGMKDEKGSVHDIKLGLNPIAIDPGNEWVYFASMTPGKLYRVPARILGDFSKPESAIEKAIEAYADKPSCDGIAAGENGAVYITNVDENAISIADKSGTKIWVKDDRFVWPDGLYIAPDGSVVVTVNQLNSAPAFNDGESFAKKPYLIMRVIDK
ncbi:MAG: L-dopachrome tautomerase-related protein [Thermodesulfobacteriota bacterium]|nr:L-dopachrome tautomerase-related protein [Thermodesulfobacteriota bacterium]